LTGATGATGPAGANGSSIGVNVKLYGAVGNNIANDTAAIISAINANPGRTIYFPYGRYLVNANAITISSSLTIIGDGQGTSIACLDATGDVFSVTSNGAVSVSNIRLDSNPVRTSGAYSIHQQERIQTHHS
jgi:hypothetical protein